jgi:hypothetical protein
LFCFVGTVVKLTCSGPLKNIFPVIQTQNSVTHHQLKH